MRRLSVAVPAALALALAWVPGVAAQDDDYQDGRHPIIGSWVVDPTPEDATEPDEVMVFVPGGAVIDSSTNSVSAGTWSSTGERTADVTFLSPAHDPDRGFMGFVTIRASVEVSGDGGAFTGTYTLEFPPAAAEGFGVQTGELGPSDVTAERVALETMGDPVGPAPDFPEGSPHAEASPVPVVSPAA